MELFLYIPLITSFDRLDVNRFHDMIVHEVEKALPAGSDMHTEFLMALISQE